jgi:phi13 family phage major tail protein
MYGLKNVHYAKLTEAVNSQGQTTYTYGTVKAWPGAVSLSLDPQGDILKEHADDIEWYTQAVNNGYEGDFEYEVMPDDFRENILGEIKDSNNVYTESADVSTNYFALLFEVNGDSKKRRNVFYKCSATREQNENETKAENITPTHGTITITAVPRADQKVKASTSDNTGDSTYNGWYSEVYESPTATT